MLDRSDGRSLRAGFLRHAAKSPRAPAMVVRGITRSYGDLESVARRWAAAIQAVSASRSERVCVFGCRSEVSYGGTMAALFSGATFVPLNVTFPPEKTAAMIEAAEPQAIIADRTCVPHLGAVLQTLRRVPPLLLPENDAAQAANWPARVMDRQELETIAPLDRLPPIVPDDIAYLLFTSGSTGKPKGVPVTHGNAVHFMDVMSERYGIGPDDRLSQTFEQTFDLSVFDLFLAWTNGACVYGMTPLELLAPATFINRNRITVWFSVPSLPAQMIRRGTLLPGTLPSLRWSLFCGEPLPRRTAELWQAAAPNSTVENLYGPTELTIACFAHRWDAERSPALCRNDLVPIGVPYSGLAAMVVDANLSPVPDCQTGELCVTGPQTTPGYWRDAAKTAERYVDLPVSHYETRRFYRTGDLVSRTASGDYVFLGRADFQIKVLGHRVELGEIEAALRRNTAVEHAVACGWPIVDGSAEGIVCFVSGNGIDPAALLNEAKGCLPPYAVPKEVMVVPEMPLNSNGKIDRNALIQRLQTVTAGA